MTCVFPMETPCGFHVIGRSPVALWDQRLANGAVLTAGDKVTFKPVSLREYDQIRAEDISATTLMQLTH
jgi:allophanate hydrolase subunit 1